MLRIEMPSQLHAVRTNMTLIMSRTRKRIPMPLSDKERQQLEALMAKDKEPDPDANTLIEIEIEGRVIRVPYGKAKPWLKKQGIDLDDILEEGAGEEDEEEDEEFD